MGTCLCVTAAPFSFLSSQMKAELKGSGSMWSATKPEGSILAVKPVGKCGVGELLLIPLMLW